MHRHILPRQLCQLFSHQDLVICLCMQASHPLGFAPAWPDTCADEEQQRRASGADSMASVCRRVHCGRAVPTKCLRGNCSTTIEWLLHRLCSCGSRSTSRRLAASPTDRPLEEDAAGAVVDTHHLHKAVGLPPHLHQLAHQVYLRAGGKKHKLAENWGALRSVPRITWSFGSDRCPASIRLSRMWGKML